MLRLLGLLLVGISAEAIRRKEVGDILAGAPVNNITVSAEGVNQCGDATIGWTGTTPPVTLSIGTGGYYVGITPIITLDNISDDSYTWNVNVTQGTDLIFQVTDSNGEVGYVQNISVDEGDDDSCLSTDDVNITESITSSSPYSYSSYIITRQGELRRQNIEDEDKEQNKIL
ncbi:hypothetical protein M231_08098 [Tremella mesenterica]|uniref:Peptidase A1 domain-containing protein n=1 Tax=Tremella mesenterica TaxID=5217 RepID=A0A4Q1B9M1_TREME|nr:hypothetical protein M231_08098 [Tremella mesenterica]